MSCPACDAENAADAESCFTCGRGLDTLTLGLVLVGRYEIRRPLGKGGMGRVYEAFDRVLEEPVAIKVLRAELTRDPEISRRFLSEIKLARKVSHRNVCRIHAYHDEAGLNFISMEYLAGRTLKEHLAQQRPSLDDAFELGVYASGFLALFALRRREPKLARPFRVPGYPWTPLLMLVVSAAFLVANIAGDPRSSALALGLLAASYPAYRLLARARDRRAAAIIR